MKTFHYEIQSLNMKTRSKWFAWKHYFKTLNSYAHSRDFIKFYTRKFHLILHIKRNDIIISFWWFARERCHNLKIFFSRKMEFCLSSVRFCRRVWIFSLFLIISVHFSLCAALKYEIPFTVLPFLTHNQPTNSLNFINYKILWHNCIIRSFYCVLCYIIYIYSLTMDAIIIISIINERIHR